MKLKTILITAVVLVVVTVILATGLPRWQYYPASMHAKSDHFIDLLMKNKRKQAWKLMHPLTQTGKKFKYFNTSVNNQFRPNLGHFPRVTSLPPSPFQSYGNKLRRFILSRPLSVKKYVVDYYFYEKNAKQASRAVDVTLKLYKGSWYVTEFHTHAW